MATQVIRIKSEILVNALPGVTHYRTCLNAKPTDMQLVKSWVEAGDVFVLEFTKGE